MIGEYIRSNKNWHLFITPHDTLLKVSILFVIGGFTFKKGCVYKLEIINEN